MNKSNPSMSFSQHRPVQIIPSVLPADWANMGQCVKDLEEAGVDRIQFDVMDGNFVDEISMGPVILESIKDLIELPIEIHLMVNDPEKNIEQFSKLNVETITFHYESTKNHYSLINLIKSKGIKAGVALNPLTEIEKLSKELNAYFFCF